MPLPVPVRLKPVNDTVVADATSLLLNVAAGLPVTFTTVVLSYGLPSVLLEPNSGVTADSNAAVPDTDAVVVPSYTLFALNRPLTDNAFAVIVAANVGCSVNV